MENSKNTIVKELIREEMSALETYRQALKKVGDQPQSQDLRRIEDDHEKAAEALKQQFGGEVDIPETAGIWATWASATEGAVNISAAINALREGEEHGVKDYEKALQESDLDPEVKELISGTLLPQTRAHVPVLERFMAMAGTSAAEKGGQRENRFKS